MAQIATDERPLFANQALQINLCELLIHHSTSNAVTSEHTAAGQS
jgi:hypothetical protein